MKEAYKLVVFPHGKVEVAPGEFAYKYILGGVLLSETEIPMTSETLIMDGNTDGELSETIAESSKFKVDFKLGDIGSAIMSLGDLTPDSESVEPQ